MSFFRDFGIPELLIIGTCIVTIVLVVIGFVIFLSFMIRKNNTPKK